ncbi:MAG: hypothetical protein HKN98_16405 [Silicimonas sp.]|nr:hypothetical protein [Silicimonas sp.]NND42964.1 hypothetical protein [Silicimonas sp.]
MTVLAKYQRLEAEAIWRPDPEDQRRDVIVSIGDATLTIGAPNGTAISHWSLPAIERRNSGQRPALYTPGADTPETLEIADDEMIDAIEAVLKAIHGKPGPTGRLRALLIALPVLAVVLAAAMWLPGAITRYTASLVPEGARAEIGTRLRDEVRRLTGAPCADASGLRALEKLQTRLFPSGGTRLVVLPSALAETAHIPDGTILIGHRLVEDHESPEVLAGYLLAEDMRRRATDPLKRILADAGLGSALRLLTTGRLDDEGLRRHAERLVASRPQPLPAKRLIAAFEAAGVPGSAYAYAIDFSGERTKPLIDASQSGAPSAPLLGDGDWIALQGICES